MSISHQRNVAPLDVVHALAQALELHQQGRLFEAEQHYSAILAANPGQADALHYLGLIRFANGRFVEALQSIAAAMRTRAPTADIFLNHGIVLNALKRHAEALESFDRAIELDSKFPAAHNNRAVVLTTVGRNEEALESYQKALAITPNDPGLLFNRANILKDLGRFESALASYNRAIVLRPGYPEAFCNRGVVLHELKRYDEALASYDRALALRPDIAEAHSNRGNVLRELKRYDEALASYDRALALRPDYAEAHSNRGATLHELKRYHEALACHDLALALQPDYADALSNRGAALSELKRINEALADYDRAIALKPDFPEPHWNTASLRLLTGDFGRGWAEYEWRWKKESMARFMRNFSQPLWLGGDDIAGKTILLHSEQGFGDTIQFCRYVPLAAARGARVILEVERPLQRLMATLAGAAQVVTKASHLPDFDLQCPLLSLPLAFQTELGTIPWSGPYLRPQSPELAAWNVRLGEKRRPRIGLAWSGKPAHERDALRSISLSALLPLLDVDATFVSLQKDVRPADAAVLDQRSDVLHFGSALNDFSDTAALISKLDLVISVDTSIVHLAGALGSPVWVLLPYIPDWRWLLDRDSTPWYPSARLFRQDDTRKWDSVISRVCEDAHKFVESAAPDSQL